MRPLVREVIRLVRSPVVILVLLLLALSGASTLQLPTEPRGSVANLGGYHVSIAYNYSGEYQFVVIVFNVAGTELTGLSAQSVQLLFAASNGTGPPLGGTSGVTNSQGLVSLVWNTLPCRCDVEINITGPGGGLTATTPLGFPAPVNLTPLWSPISIVPSGVFLAVPLLVVAFSDGAGHVPSGTNLSYCVSAPSSGGPSECPSHSLGAVTSYLQSFPSVRSLSLSDSDVIDFNLTGPGGALLYTQQIPFSAVDPTQASETFSAVRLVGGVETMSFIVAIAGILLGFVGYGRDRLSGSLDPVLALPITRMQLLLSRYAGVALVSVLGSTMGAVVLGFTITRAAGVPLPTSLWIGLVVAFAVEGIAFVGLTFLGAHLMKSSALLLVVLILLCAALTILWIPVVSLVTTLSGSPTDLTSASAQSGFAGWNPAQCAISIVGLAVFSFDGQGPYLLPTITNPGLLTALILTWMAAPLGLASLLFRYRD